MTTEADDVRDLIEATDDAETVTFKPGVGAERSVRALVFRQSLDGLPGRRSIPSGAIDIQVPNSAVFGISSSELDAGRDKISVADRPGKTPADRAVTAIIECGSGHMLLEVR